jgi:hypothetical protein
MGLYDDTDFEMDPKNWKGRNLIGIKCATRIYKYNLPDLPKCSVGILRRD